MKLFNSNKSTYFVYLIISIFAIGLSCLSLLIPNQYDYYPIVITAISFLFGFLYLFMMFFENDKKINMEADKNLNMMKLMGFNFLRFLTIALGAAASALFIFLMPHEGEVDKWVVALILISGIPMLINIGLFYLRGKAINAK